MSCSISRNVASAVASAIASGEYSLVTPSADEIAVLSRLFENYVADVSELQNTFEKTKRLIRFLIGVQLRNSSKAELNNMIASSLAV